MDARLPESVSSSLLRLRAIGYLISAPALAVAWWVDRSTELAILAAAATLVLIGNTVRLPKATPVRALAVDLAGAGLIWWMFGPISVVYFLLAYVVVIAPLVLDRVPAIRMIAATATVTFGMGMTHFLAGGRELPLFHGSAEGWIDALGEFGLALAIVVYTAVIMLGISKTIDRSRTDLAASEQQMRLSFDGAAMGMVTFELEGNITKVNQAFCEQVGYDARTVLTMNWRDLVAAADQSGAENRLRNALNGGADHWRVEDRLVRSDGSIFWAGIVVTLIRDEEGTPRSYFAQTVDISEQKAAKEAIAASEERYRSLFEGIPAALYRTNPDGRILDANPALVELLGFANREELLEVDVHDAYVDRGRRDEIATMLKNNGRLIGIEEQLRRSDGTAIWVRDSSRVVLDQHGDIAYFEGALTDTTARHEAEEALQESEAQLRAVFEHAPIGIVAVDLEWRIVTANPALAHILGRPVEELIGTRILNFSHPDDLLLDFSLSGQLLANEIPSYRFSKRYLHADGHTIWAEISATAVRDDDGRPELLLGLIQDITDRHNAEEDRAQMIKILEATPDIVAIFDIQGHPTYANQAAREWYKLESQSSMSHLNIGELFVTDSPDNTIGEIFQALRTAGSWQGDVTLQSPTGQTLPGSAVVLAHTDAGGKITHISGSFRDLSEHIETQRRLERLIRSKDEFIASVSHELRTPLTAVVGLAHELRSSWRVFSTDEISEFIGLVANQASDVANLVEDLLVAARVDIGKVTVAPRVVEIAEQIEGVVAAFDAPSRRRIMATVDHATAWADPGRLRQVIRNLITNAIRYGGQHIEVTTAVEDGFVAVHVSDDGPGISLGQEEQIFQAYERDHEPGSQPSSVGLGLTVSRHLARLMGGDLIYSREDHRFTLTLPEPAVVPAHRS